MCSTVYIGQIFNPISLEKYEEYSDGFVVVANGKIRAYGGDSAKWNCFVEPNESVDIVRLSKTQFLMPGFVDCHIHGPQFPNMGLGMDLPLMEWLNKYTFPLESKYSDVEFAAKVYKSVVWSTIQHGTTLASYFGSNHREATVILAQEAHKQGQRALVGKVCSNQNCPSFYVETTADSLSETKTFVDLVKNLRSDLVQPIITPRFAVSCTMELMSGLAQIAKSKNLHIQSHISENLDEIKFMKELFDNKSYAQVYDEAGLLTDKTVMAHAVHLEDSEIDVFARTGTSVAHCPNSNTNLASGRCHVSRLLQKGVKVGLGTDVSGGSSPSILDAALKAMDVSHHCCFSGTSHKAIDFKQALYLATLGGAEALAMAHQTGNFKVGKHFDALLIDVGVFPIVHIQIPRAEQPLSSGEKLSELIQKFVYTGDDRNIIEVFVNGKNIKKHDVRCEVKYFQ